MNKIFLLLLLASCRGIPPKSNLTIERCFIVIEQEIVSENGKLSYMGHCRCHNWSISKDSIGRSSDSENRPLLYCDKKGGMNGDDWGKTTIFLEDWRLYLRKQ